MSQSMFGTDGVRGVPGRFPLDAETVMKLGSAIADELGSASRLVCGRDTRESGPRLQRQLAAGIREAGGTIVSAGVVPTPAVAYVTAHAGFDAGLVISASHNPYTDNGIKVLATNGEKLSRATERRVESRVAAADTIAAAADSDPEDAADLVERWVEQLHAIVDGADLSGRRVAIDCGHGATSAFAPRVLRACGVTPVVLHAAPDGRNINRESGSTHPGALQRAVVDEDCEIGFAFDGDGDRVILVDRRGRIVDGDGVLYLAARQLRATGQLAGNGVVATVMSNFGLEVALQEAGIAVHRCPVGDWHVREEMVRQGVCLGGEQSGHIIFSDLLPTGDGLATALMVLRMVVDAGCPLDELVEGLTILPQVLLNVEVAHKRDIEDVPALRDAIRAADAQLAGHGRVLVRYSGTEPLLRIMLEGPEQTTVDRLARELASCAQEALS